MINGIGGAIRGRRPMIFKKTQRAFHSTSLYTSKLTSLINTPTFFDFLPLVQSYIMASNSQDSAFNILGSSKLNTTDGKNPTSSATTSTSTQPGAGRGQKNSEEYRQVRTHFRLIFPYLGPRPESQGMLWEQPGPLLLRPASGS